jgi:hypothetical protein
LVLGQGANGDASVSPAGTGLVLIPKGAAGATRTFLRLDETGTASNSSQQILARNTAQSWDQGAIRFTRDAANNDFHIDLVPATSGALNTTNIARLTDTGNLLIGGTTDITGSGGLKVFGTTASTSTTTGALQVAGGVGVAGSLYVGGTTNSVGVISSTGGNAALQLYDRTTGAGDAWLLSATGGSDFTFVNTGNANLTLAKNGNATVRGAIAIGNTVNTVTATLPNRTITMVIGGTTYYIHAKTTND